MIPTAFCHRKSQQIFPAPAHKEGQLFDAKTFSRLDGDGARKVCRRMSIQFGHHFLDGHLLRFLHGH